MGRWSEDRDLNHAGEAEVAVRVRAVGGAVESDGEKHGGGDGREKGEDRDDPPGADADAVSFDCCGGAGPGGGSPCESPANLIDPVQRLRRGANGHPPTYGFGYLFRVAQAGGPSSCGTRVALGD
jgi:hypothetical protein